MNPQENFANPFSVSQRELPPFPRFISSGRERVPRSAIILRVPPPGETLRLLLPRLSLGQRRYEAVRHSTKQLGPRGRAAQEYRGRVAARSLSFTAERAEGFRAGKSVCEIRLRD